MTHLNITLPTPQGRDLTEREATALLGQWVTVLFMGESHMAQVQEVTVLPWDVTRMELLALIGEPKVEEPAITPEFTGHEGAHINCEHDPAPRVGQERTCSYEDTQDLGHGQA